MLLLFFNFNKLIKNFCNFILLISLTSIIFLRSEYGFDIYFKLLAYSTQY